MFGLKGNIALIITAIMVILQAAPAFATADYTLTFDYGGDPVTHIEMLNYECNDNGCSDIGALVESAYSGSSDTVTTHYPVPAPTYGYATYWYAPCFHYQKMTWKPTSFDDGITYTDSATFTKTMICRAQIDNVNVPSFVDVGDDVEISIDVESPFETIQTAPLATPDDPSFVRDYLSAETSVTLTIRNSGDSVVFTDTKNLYIERSTQEEVVFDTWTPAYADNYLIDISTEVNDCKCSSDVIETHLDSITVTGGTDGGNEPPVVNSVEINPVIPEDWDDLTCNAIVSDDDGNLERIRFSWLRNTVGIRYIEKFVTGSSDIEHDTLDRAFTEEGDQIKCRVEVWDDEGEYHSDYTTVVVQQTSHNNPPIIQGIPDKFVEIGDDLTIDLWDYAFDYEDSDGFLDFGLVSQGNTNIIECFVSNDRYLVCSQAKQLGDSSVTVRVTDTGGAWDTDTFDITVESGIIDPENEPPVIDFIDIDPSSPDENDDLTCEVRASDDDGNLDTVEFRWYVEGDLERTRIKQVSGMIDTTYDTLDESNFDDNDDVECRVTVEDDMGEEDTASESVEIGDDEDEDRCRIDVRDLYVDDGEYIEFRIRNTGEKTADVDYRIYIDGDRVEDDNIDNIEEDESEKISFRWFDFEEGETYRIRVRADADCGTEDDSDESSVTYTLMNGGPIPGPTPDPWCSLSIENFEYSKNLAKGQVGHVSAAVRNTGSRSDSYGMEFYLNGVYLGRKTFTLSPNSAITRIWNFYSSGERETIRIVVNSGCGATGYREGTVNSGKIEPPPETVCNYNQVCEPGENWYNCPYDCDRPEVKAPTDVDISPSSMDIELYKSKVISIDIHSFVPQEFRISVSGVPDNWIDYQDSVYVDDYMTTYVFVNPKERGSERINVVVEADKEGLTFREDIKLFVAVEERDSDFYDPLTGTIIGITGNIWAIFFVIIAAAAMLIWFSHYYLKSESEVTFDKR